MKKIVYLIALTFIFSSLAYANDAKLPVAQGKTNSELGIYTIDRADNLQMIKGEPLRAYIIMYENSPDTLTVAVDDSRKGITRFLVISDNLVIEYIRNKASFGACIIGERFAKEGFSTPSEKLDRQQYYHQKIISREAKTETEYLCLISVFFPKLIRDYNNIYAQKN
ncbi:MAG: hypothetical protein U9N72_11525 [Bacteroidota bacterium]|nr:hypothetical protein [Bacteroidota bacterium]